MSVQTFWCQWTDAWSKMCSVTVWYPVKWFTCRLFGVCSSSRRMKGMSTLIRAAELAQFWVNVCICVFMPVLWSLSSREIGAALRQWPCSHPSQLLLSSPSISLFPPLPVSSVTVSLLICPLLLLTQMLCKQLPCISVHLCAQVPF